MRICYLFCGYQIYKHIFRYPDTERGGEREREEEGREWEREGERERRRERERGERE